MAIPATVGTRFDPVTLEILWSRLTGVADEMWKTILRTSFSTIIGAALDYGCVLVDAQGGQLTHASGSMPGFNLALPLMTREVLRCFEGQISPGDVFIGNDPWLCCGHIPDVATITPVFSRHRLIAFATCVGHQADFGGIEMHKRVREVYEEGLFLPMMKFYDRGERNETLIQVIKANVRAPDMVIGDLEAQVAANEVGAQRLLALIEEYGLDDLTTLSTEIQERSERAMREIIRQLPNGIYRAEGWAGGFGDAFDIRVAITIEDDELVVDYTGTANQVEFGGVNCTLSYTSHTTRNAIKCILAPHIPHNEGSTRPLRVHAPEGSILNCTFPAAVSSRTYVGFHLHAPIFSALAQILPDRVCAGPGLMQGIRIVGRYPDGRPYNSPLFAGGGRGGSGTQDGVGGFVYPSNAANIPIEIFENSCPAMIVSKEFTPDSAGVGLFRGGPGQRVRIRKLPYYDAPVRVRYMPMRGRVRAPGLFGGQDGNLSEPLWNGQPVASDSELGRDGWTSFRAATDELSYNVPSGGGFGDPRKRDAAAVERDLGQGLITPEGAQRDYGYPRLPRRD